MQAPSTEKACPRCGKHFGQQAVICPDDGSLLTTPSPLSNPDSLIGQYIGPYKIVSLRNTGSKSFIFEAEHAESNRPAAIKLLRPDLAKNKNSLARFQQEAQMAASLAHTNAVSINDSGMTEQGQPYLIMELLNGVTLKELIAKHGPLDLPSFQIIFRQLCGVLEHAHNLGIVHRDLKTDHIIISITDDINPQVKLLDFGCSKQLEREQKLTVAGVVLGNAEYMSPEQCLAQEIDARSDIYSLACIMYEALTGKKPFEGGVVELMQMHLKNEPSSLSKANNSVTIPSKLDKAILKALAKDPGQRQQSIKELWMDIEKSFDPNGFPSNDDKNQSGKTNFLKELINRLGKKPS